MAILWGATSGGFRLGIDITGSGSTRTIIVYGQSVGYGHNWTETLNLGGSLSGTRSVSFYSPSSGTVTKEFYRTTQTWTGARTFTASISYWNGSASVSRGLTITVGSKPGAPSNFSFTRNSDTQITLTFTKGSGATSTQFTRSINNGTWADLANTTGSSQTVSFSVDNFYRFMAYSINAAGSSAAVGPLLVYTKPEAPSVPELAGGGQVSWRVLSKYCHGVQVERSDGGAVTVVGDRVSSWVDPAAQSVETKYRVRVYAGDGDARAWSDWSAWSEAALDVVYKPPRISKFTADRCNSAGQLDPLGTYIRAVSSGEVFSVKESPSGPELNKRTVRFRHRLVGASSWLSWVSLVTDAAPAAWSNAGVTFGGGNVTVDDAYEAQMQVVDAFGQVQQQVTVPVAKTALSIGPAGIGVGKVIERGALDVGGDAHIDGDVYVTGHVSTVDPNIVIIGGQPYEVEGRIRFNLGLPVSTTGGYRRDHPLTMPAAPPVGYEYAFSAVSTEIGGGHVTWVGIVEGADTVVPTVRVFSPTSAQRWYAIYWRLVKV